MATASSPSLPLLWLSVLTGPIAFATDLTVGYILMPLACRGLQWPLHVLGLATLLITIAAGAYAAGRLKAHDSTTARFLARLGILSAMLFGLLLVAQAIPRFLLEPCAV